VARHDAARGRAVIRAALAEGGQVLEVALAAPPRNVLDGAALRELVAALSLAAGPHCKVILLHAVGPSFSYGASVAEHAPAQAPGMLAAFDAAVRALLAPSLPIVAAVQGQCLGAGLELVSLASYVIAHLDACLGQPEIRLGALAPVASVVLPRRIGQARAEQLLCSGRVIGAAEALRVGLCDETTGEMPVDVARAWIHACLLPHSASSLRLACRAARAGLLRDLETLLPEMNRLYREELLATADAAEAARAFVEKRAPRWQDR
jgi:cyclohexa-1,5-dienecarbonyl-CoA hydratase